MHCIIALFITICYGILFTFFQYYEYKFAYFTIFDGVYGSCFFMLTGLHGLHVLIGTLFLFLCFFRLIYQHFLSFHHVGFEAAI